MSIEEIKVLVGQLRGMGWTEREIVRLISIERGW